MKLSAHTIAVSLHDRPILHGVSIDIAPGRITGIVGPNGAGKSTLLKTMAGLLRPQSGSIRLDGEPMAGLSRNDLARRIAYLPQDRHVHWPLPVRAIVALGRLPHGAHGPDFGPTDSTVIDAALAAMDATALADRPATELSGGERARVLFARALAQEAPVILADEPTAGLDPAHALELFDVLGRLAQEGRAIAIALHDLTFAARFCHHVVMLQGGRVAAAGAAADVLTGERLRAVFGVDMAVGRLRDLPVVVPIGRSS